jgi:hypothetical protein
MIEAVQASVPPQLPPSGAPRVAGAAPEAAASDQVDISAVARLAAFLAQAPADPSIEEQLERAFFDLSSRDFDRLLEVLNAPVSPDAAGLLTQLADLLKQGIIGWEYREEKDTNRPYRVFLDVGLSADSWAGLRPWRNRNSFPV